jgi:zinc/manganese transport system permease protein
MHSVDATFLRSVSRAGPWVHGLLLVLVVANLVSAFQALGTLMAVGQMMLPAIAARFWADRLAAMVAVAVAIAVVSGAAGLLLSFHAEVPSGPSIVLVSGAAYLLSVLFGRVDGALPQWLRRSRAALAGEGVR